MHANNKHTTPHGLSALELIHNATIEELLEQASETAETTFAEALRVINAVMREGSKKHPTNDWMRRTADFHVRRAQLHLSLLRNGDKATAEDHLSHAACRILMSLALRERTRNG